MDGVVFEDRFAATCIVALPAMEPAAGERGKRAPGWSPRARPLIVVRVAPRHIPDQQEGGVERPQSSAERIRALTAQWPCVWAPLDVGGGQRDGKECLPRHGLDFFGPYTPRHMGSADPVDVGILFDCELAPADFASVLLAFLPKGELADEQTFVSCRLWRRGRRG